MPKNPCHGYCPKRNAECHSNCKEYSDYRAECDEEREKRKQLSMATPDPTPIVIRALKRRNKTWNTTKKK